ncbi:hypothetical protein CAPTEDRAFT_148915 [Capitella teleta]|uniref:SAM domain-containing protein n=1 Tax=Capitella teleta TaxID=283909 RepID=R7VIR9_CAPTE|nr:hypothetical protein CAPTEDRAFT_148915 [Capitella teleta]|eukprot:ELU15615.1 hypothetical protein CAPTEDRAFT_148915 [Capitella teleta]
MTVPQWSVAEVRIWLGNRGMGQFSETLCVQHKVDGQVLLSLTETDVREMIGTSCLGDVKRLTLAVKELQLATPTPYDHIRSSNGSSPAKAVYARFDSEGSTLSDDALTHKRISRRLEPEYSKLFLSYCYMFSVFLITAFVMVIVHDRVPDMEKYPPLPDIVLDNLPYIPWAFDACEAAGVVLVLIWTVTMFFHKHRFIVLRRMFSLAGTVFLLRCFTMLITSLSVPGAHLQCSPKNYDSLWSKLQRAIAISKGFGMSLQGVRTCGDYMFSGHTVVVTLLNFFITEYTPRRMHWLHTLTWVINIFAVFFILAAHEHYSIDVFVAFYITSRLFLYYHSLANNRVLHQGDRRTRIWFPMFSFFESTIDGIIPNEYEWPLSLPWRSAAKSD